jgi:hypothetical protein
VREFRNLAIARIVVERLEALEMKRPKPSVDLKQIRREYHAAKGCIDSLEPDGACGPRQLQGGVPERKFFSIV